MSNMQKVGEALIKARFPNSRFYVTDGDKTWKDTHDWKIVERELNLSRKADIRATNGGGSAG